MSRRLNIAVHPRGYAICRLSADAGVPEWATGRAFLCIARTAAELSIVCEERGVPTEIRAERDRRLLEIEGPLDFSWTGVLASIANPLAEAQISIFAVSTYDTDYVLVANVDLERAVAALERAGHSVHKLP